MLAVVVMAAMTPKRFRSTAAWQRARALALRGATHCALCGGALRFDVRPRHSLAPSVDHVRPLATLDLNSAEGRAVALDQALLRPCHVGCNSTRANVSRRGRPGRRRRNPARVAGARSRAESWLGEPRVTSRAW